MTFRADDVRVVYDAAALGGVLPCGPFVKAACACGAVYIDTPDHRCDATPMDSMPAVDIMHLRPGPIMPVTTACQVQLVGVPLCPDLLRWEQLGAADGWRGRVVRGFFWLLRAWPA